MHWEVWDGRMMNIRMCAGCHITILQVNPNKCSIKNGRRWRERYKFHVSFVKAIHGECSMWRSPLPPLSLLLPCVQFWMRKSLGQYSACILWCAMHIVSIYVEGLPVVSRGHHSAPCPNLFPWLLTSVLPWAHVVWNSHTYHHSLPSSPHCSPWCTVCIVQGKSDFATRISSNCISYYSCTSQRTFSKALIIITYRHSGSEKCDAVLSPKTVIWNRTHW